MIFCLFNFNYSRRFNNNFYRYCCCCLISQLDGFAAPQLKNSYKKMKSDWLATRSQVDELRTRHADMQEKLDEEREEHRRALNQLKDDCELAKREMSFIIYISYTFDKACNLMLKNHFSLPFFFFVVKLMLPNSSRNCESRTVWKLIEIFFLFFFPSIIYTFFLELSHAIHYCQKLNNHNGARCIYFINKKVPQLIYNQCAYFYYILFAVETQHACTLSSLEASLQEKFERERTSAIARLRGKYEAELAHQREFETEKKSIVHDHGASLRAEVDSLKTVLTLKSEEASSLRAETDNLRRELDEKDGVEMRAMSLEARCEDLQAQLQRKESQERQISHEYRVLMESYHQVSVNNIFCTKLNQNNYSFANNDFFSPAKVVKQNKRLMQRNEELQWKLRQKNEVVSVLANQLSPSPRLTRSLGPEHIDHSITPDKNNAHHCSSVVKFMVEKGDSVSWTLEIDESGGESSPPPPQLTRTPFSKVSRQGVYILSVVSIKKK